MRTIYLFLSILCIVSTYAADIPNVLFWERSFEMNISDSNLYYAGTLNQSSSYLTSCQDFQGINIDSQRLNLPNRAVFNFGECCKSSNTTIDTVQSLNNNSIEAGNIIYAQKIALVKRGNCNWSEKLSVVSELSRNNGLNVTAMFIYDNDTHSTNISIERTFVRGGATVSAREYETVLPDVRNVANMSDNDLLLDHPNFSTKVYFIPLIYGETFIQRIKDSFDPNMPNIRKYWLLTAYSPNESSDNDSNYGLLSSGRTYLSYIIALGAIFIIGVIFLRWWKIRRLRADYPDGFITTNAFGMQPRVTHNDPLPVHIVNSIPIAKYADDLVKNVNCAICLEDFVPGKNDIRILPCAHGFCVLCIDPWLTQKSCMCPICKWDCLPNDLRRERNEQLQRNRNASQTTNDNNDLQAENHSQVITMPAPPYTNASPEFQHSEDPTLSTAHIIPSSPPTTTNTTPNTAPLSDLNEKDRPRLKNPFESNPSMTSGQSAESSNPTTPSPSSHRDTVPTSEKNSSLKD